MPEQGYDAELDYQEAMLTMEANDFFAIASIKVNRDSPEICDTGIW